MFIQFLISFCAALVALTLLELLKGKQPRTPNCFRFPSPTDATQMDLAKYFEAVNKALNNDFKGESFPIKIPFPCLASWTNHKEAKEIICGILTKQGWVVVPTNNPNSIKLDLPRVKSLSSIEPT